MVPIVIHSKIKGSIPLAPRIFSGRVILRNVAANLASGVAGALLAVVLPPFLVRLMDRNTYSVWALLLQIGGYSGVLNFGFQTAVARYVAHASARKNSEYRDEIISTSIILLAVSAMIGIIAMVTLSAYLPFLFPAIPMYLQKFAKLALIWVGISLAVGLPFSVINGIFTGLQRNEVPAIIIIISRFFTGVGLVLAAKLGYSLVGMAVVFFGVNLMTYGIQWLSLKKILPDIQISFKKVSRSSVHELVDYCTSLTVWNMAVLLVSGLNLAIVARFDFPSVGAFAIALSLIALLQGAQGAVMNVFLPVGAALEANGDRERLSRLLIATTRWNIFTLGGGLMVYFIIGPFLLIKYVGSSYFGPVASILNVLLLGHITRLSMAPFAVLAIAAGDHRKVILSPLIEGFTNVGISLMLGARYGAIGVAWGTFIGSTAGVLLHLFMNLPRSERLGVSLRLFIKAAFLPAILALSPWLILLIYHNLSVDWKLHEMRHILIALTVSATIIFVNHKYNPPSALRYD